MAVPFNREKLFLCTDTFSMVLWKRFRVLEVKGRPGITVRAGCPCFFDKQGARESEERVTP